MRKIMLTTVSLLASPFVHAAQDSLTVPFSLVSAEGTGRSIGKVVVTETAAGLLFTPALKDLPPGAHGFHVHENPSCDPGEKDGKASAALKAGGHFDPTQSGKHGGPESGGHEGDLPRIVIGPDGTGTTPVMAPRLKKLAVLEGHALIIHAGSDNYSDVPKPLGGGGERIACGIAR